MQVLIAYNTYQYKETTQDAAATTMFKVSFIDMLSTTQHQPLQSKVAKTLIYHIFTSKTMSWRSGHKEAWKITWSLINARIS